MTFDIASHTEAAQRLRHDVGFTRLHVADLIGLIDFIIGLCRTGLTLSDGDLEALKPFCGAADQLLKHTGQVAIRCEDYCRLVSIAKALTAEESQAYATPTRGTETTPPPWASNLSDLSDQSDLSEKESL